MDCERQCRVPNGDVPYDATGYRVSEFSNSGATLSPPTGFMGGFLNEPLAVAVEGSGNVWVSNVSSRNITEFVGAAVPVVTPLSVGVKNGTLGTRP
jgi:hypothetical protein